MVDIGLPHKIDSNKYEDIYDTSSKNSCLTAAMKLGWNDPEGDKVIKHLTLDPKKAEEEELTLITNSQLNALKGKIKPTNL